MKLLSLAVLFTSVEAIRMKSSMPTGQETLCVMRRTGKLDLEGTFFNKKFNENRDGGFNAVALVQTDGDDEEKKEGKKGKPVLDQTSFERFLQRNMGNNAGLVYNAEF